MDKLEKYLDELLIFMADEIEKNAGTTKTIEFNFSFEFIEKYFNADDERFEDGKDLKELKKIINIKDNELIKKVLMKAINEELIKRTVIGGREFSKIQLTDNGFRKSKAIKLNKIENNKKWLKYIFEKLFLPILVSIITVLITFYITSKIQNKNVNNELENIKKEIEWLKQKK